MKTIAEVRDSIVRGVLMERNIGDAQIDQVLREYAESIVQMCVNNFECTMEQRDVEDAENVTVYTLENGDQVYPVLVRESILAVKNQIK